MINEFIPVFYFLLHVKGPKYEENFQTETVWVKIRCQGYEGLDFLPLSLICCEYLKMESMDENRIHVGGDLSVSDTQ